MDSRDISAFIIAGGQSRRFGEDKALFMYRGRPLIEHVVEAIRPVINRIAIVGDSAEKFGYLGLPYHADSIAGMGPFGGVYTALQKAETGRVFVFACDMPGLDTGLIRYMSSLSQEFDATVPVVNEKYEPLHAVYSKSCVAPMDNSIQKGKRRIVSFFDAVSVRPVTEDEIRVYTDPKLVFRNINYRNDANE